MLKGKKVLYMTHLAIGDYVYQRQYLRKLKQQYPNIEIDIWIDDCRVRHKKWHSARNNTLSQWLGSEPFINQIYPIVANASERQNLIDKAIDENYDLVFFVALNRCERYARIARVIAQSSLAVGTKSATIGNPLTRWWHFSRLDNFLTLQHTQNYSHISDLYGQAFETCLGLDQDDSSRVDSIDIPHTYKLAAVELLGEIAKHKPGRSLFINHLSTSEKRDYSWPKLRELLISLNQCEDNLSFVINVPPVEFLSTQQKVLDDPKLKHLRALVFCADEHFLQLPALINACDIVISVETAVMHLADALGKKQVVLMRAMAEQWRPRYADHVLFGDNRVDQIAVQDIVSAVRTII